MSDSAALSWSACSRNVTAQLYLRCQVYHGNYVPDTTPNRAELICVYAVLVPILKHSYDSRCQVYHRSYIPGYDSQQSWTDLCVSVGVCGPRPDLRTQLWPQVSSIPQELSSWIRLSTELSWSVSSGRVTVWAKSPLREAIKNGIAVNCNGDTLKENSQKTENRYKSNRANPQRQEKEHLLSLWRNRHYHLKAKLNDF